MRLLGNESAVPHERLSITDAPAVDALMAAIRPEVVFNCAAYNAVDRAEDEPGVALKLNRDGPANVAAACSRHGARLVHFSTNFVFDGRQARPYVESDHARPLGAYGFSKFAGERSVLAADPKALIVRTAAVYGRVGTGFPERILERVRAHGELEMVTDQRVNPTSAADLAERVVGLVGEEVGGVVHLVGSGCCTWHEFSQAVLDEVGVVAPILPLTSDQLHTRATRPANGCLASERIELLRSWREALHEWARQTRLA